MLKLFRRAARRDRGAAAVEFALVAPLLLLLVFGLIDFGRMLNAKIAVTEAAREGARSAALERDVDKMNDRVTTSSSGITGGSASVTSYTLCNIKPAAGSDATVTVTYRFEYITPVGAIAGLFGGSSWGAFNMKATGVMPCRA